MTQETFTYRDEFRPVFDQFQPIRDHIQYFGGNATQTAIAEPRVVIIDTGVWHNHPNLKDGIESELMADFSLHDEGNRPFGTDDLDQEHERARAFAQRIRTRISSGANLLPAYEHKLSVFGAPVEDSWPLDWRFNAHGTAIAGLVGGRSGVARWRGHQVPVVVRSNGKSDPVEGFKLQTIKAELDFQGVCPTAKMIPISTGFDMRPQSLINALIYAYSLSPDIIVLPRDLPGPNSFVSAQGGAARPRPGDAERITALNILHEIVKDVASEIPFFCAAGNEGTSSMIFPASLKECRSVGARALGKDHATPYSNGDADILAPSGDGESVTRSGWQINFDAKGLNLKSLPPQLDKDNNPSPFEVRQIIATDLPGSYGYNESGEFEAYHGEVANSDVAVMPARNDAHADDNDPVFHELTSLYCFFSGTSAAVAIAAGVAAQLLVDGQKPSNDRIRLALESL